METNKLGIYCLLLLIMINAVAQGMMVYKTEKQMTTIQTKLNLVMNEAINYNLLNPDNKEVTKLRGAYFSSGYYCVSTIGRSPYEINMTDYHEMCHAFVAMDKNHFCNKQNQTAWNIEDYIKP